MPFSTETASNAGKKSSRKGIANKTTSEIKEAYQLLIENNLENMTSWLEKIGEDNPEKAFDLIIKMSDFIVPKLSRQEVKMEKPILSPEQRKERIKLLLAKAKELE